jgi:hypothetical protein
MAWLGAAGAALTTPSRRWPGWLYRVRADEDWSGRASLIGKLRQLAGALVKCLGAAASNQNEVVREGNR